MILELKSNLGLTLLYRDSLCLEPDSRLPIELFSFYVLGRRVAYLDINGPASIAVVTNVHRGVVEA